MGLAAPKNKIKLSHDPNNTKWTSDTKSFGHRMMSSQGWKPGEYLGAKNAPHAEFHTAANASHIRVSIKDDNLGLGAKIGSGVGHGECTGLDAFKNLLGRLNGKDEDEIEKEQKSREDLKRTIYTERRWGSIRFVQGGFLVGDKIQHLIDGEVERVRKLAAGDVGSESCSGDSTDSTDSDTEPKQAAEKPKKSKKRKLEELTEVPEVIAIKIKKPKKKKKQKSEGTSEDAAETTTALGDVKLSQKKSKRKRETQAAIEDEEATETKNQRKEKRKKEKKEKKDKSKSGQEEGPAKEPREKKSVDPQPLSSLTTRPPTKENTPSTPLEVDSGRSTPMMQGRHAVRSRNIAQKRLASMDVAALNQIFMIKS